MALSDPTNVRIGLARKQQLLQRLAQQMAAGGGGKYLPPSAVRAMGGRAQGTGSQFASAVNLRTAGNAKLTLPFTLPANRVRPTGFDPDQSGGNAWAAPQDLAVTPSGPAAGAGDTGAAAAPVFDTTTPTGQGGIVRDSSGMVITNPAPNQQDNYAIPDNTGTYATPPGSTFGNGVSLESGWNPSTPLNQPAPDPYTMMADAQMRRIVAGQRYAV
jgi:hypothetical protein